MTQEQILTIVTKTLAGHAIPYMITGSLAVVFYGRPRYTHDLDIVLAVSRASIERLRGALKALSKHFHLFVDLSSLDTVLASQQMISLLDHTSGMKVDLWILGQDPFAKEVFGRRLTKQVLKASIHFISPEDLILTKLVWSKQSESSRHLEDIYTVYEGQKGKLDEQYITKWAKKLSVESLLRKAKAMADPQQ